MSRRDWLQLSEHGLDVNGLLVEVGQTLLQWGFLETAMRAAQFDWKRSVASVDESDPDFAILQDLAEPKSIRNLLAHGLKRVFANPWADEEPYVVCRSLTDGERLIRLSDLRRTQQQLLKLRREFHA